MQKNRDDIRYERSKLRRELLGKKEMLRRHQVKIESIELDERMVKAEKARLRSDMDTNKDKIKSIEGELRRLDESIENNKRIKSRVIEENKRKELESTEKDNELREIEIDKGKVEYDINKVETEIRKLDNTIKTLR